MRHFRWDNSGSGGGCNDNNNNNEGDLSGDDDDDEVEVVLRSVDDFFRWVYCGSILTLGEQMLPQSRA